uniref:Uncharacterized protein n=1 Tax=Candidatus Kentrum eta TaxID=2126337 RepID=A0A450UFZ2_9GAMM|nr:MAG: hypothetical protein BECKH772A_GA0070896_100325 [Candidatus Kentron sp. H]VFJ92612.1 MAG: hypothetical protein BECKH772B_GA0070898_1003130 [Candidatus Kentron sp. H]VFJ99333.1 MAG: hypothetical protein BECKH772C_GA0070978_100316 [Candidatus Kentron sp. H]
MNWPQAGLGHIQSWGSATLAVFPQAIPTQVEIGNHLDLSDRSVREILPKLGIDHRQSNLSTIRIAYIRDLRETAAGRGGDEQVNLTLQRTRQAEADANLKQLELFARAQRLVSIDELEPKLAHWASMARNEVGNLSALRAQAERGWALVRASDPTGSLYF